MLDYHIFNPDMFGDNGNGVNSAATRDGNMDGTVFNGTVSGTYTLNPHIVFDSYFGLTRLDTSQVPVSAYKGDLGLNRVRSAGDERSRARLCRISFVQHQQLCGVWKVRRFTGLLFRPGV